MSGEETRQLASIAAVAEDLDRILDKLFKTAAELKVILTNVKPGVTGTTQGGASERDHA